MLIVLGAFRDLPSDGTGPAQSEPSLAILPFSNLDGDPDVRLPERPTQRGPRDRPVAGPRPQGDLARFEFRLSRRGARLRRDRAGSRGADLVRGTVRHDGERVRINVALVDTMSGETIWAECFDKTIENVFTVQDDVTAEIVSALSLEFAPDHQEPRPVDPMPTTCCCAGCNHCVSSRRRETRRRVTISSGRSRSTRPTPAPTPISRSATAATSSSETTTTQPTSSGRG